MDRLSYAVNRYSPVNGATNKIMKDLIHNIECNKASMIIEYYTGAINKEELDNYMNRSIIDWIIEELQ